VNGKHRAVFLSQDRVDMADQGPPARVTSFQFDQMPTEPFRGELWVPSEVGEHRSNLGQTHVDAAQHGNESSSAELI
jgi:hypothetical protein